MSHGGRNLKPHTFLFLQTHLYTHEIGLTFLGPKRTSKGKTKGPNNIHTHVLKEIKKCLLFIFVVFKILFFFLSREARL